jgi:Ca2+-binding RTX toxin-like protein
VLIGGAGADLLQGSWGSDLLVGGSTDFDLDPTALAAVAAEWSSPSSYADRVAHLTAPSGGLNGTTFFNTATVHDDGVADVLRGWYGLDWFWTGALDPSFLSTGEVAAHS